MTPAALILFSAVLLSRAAAVVSSPNTNRVDALEASIERDLSRLETDISSVRNRDGGTGGSTHSRGEVGQGGDISATSSFLSSDAMRSSEGDGVDDETLFREERLQERSRFIRSFEMCRQGRLTVSSIDLGDARLAARFEGGSKRAHVSCRMMMRARTTTGKKSYDERCLMYFSKRVTRSVPVVVDGGGGGGGSSSIIAAWLDVGARRLAFPKPLVFDFPVVEFADMAECTLFVTGARGGSRASKLRKTWRSVVSDAGKKIFRSGSTGGKDDDEDSIAASHLDPDNDNDVDDDSSVEDIEAATEAAVAGFRITSADQARYVVVDGKRQADHADDEEEDARRGRAFDESRDSVTVPLLSTAFGTDTRTAAVLGALRTKDGVRPMPELQQCLVGKPHPRGGRAKASAKVHFECLSSPWEENAFIPRTKENRERLVDHLLYRRISSGFNDRFETAHDRLARRWRDGRKCPLVFAHRGVTGGREGANTPAGLLRAFRRGIDGGEVDVFLTADGRGGHTPVVSHDDSLVRAVGLHGKLSSLESLDSLGRIREVTGCVEIFPTLDAFLDELGKFPDYHIDVEVKPESPFDVPFRSYPRLLGSAVGRLLRRERRTPDGESYRAADRAVVTGFNAAILREVNKDDGGVAGGDAGGDAGIIPVGLATHNSLQARALSGLSRLFKVTEESAEIYQYTLLSKGVVDKAHGRGRLVGTYTIFDNLEPRDSDGNRDSIAARIAATGVDWVESDQPERLAKLFDGLGCNEKDRKAFQENQAKFYNESEESRKQLREYRADAERQADRLIHLNERYLALKRARMD